MNKPREGPAVPFLDNSSPSDRMNGISRFRPGILLAFAALCLLPGCQTLRELSALRKVDFAIDHVAEVRLAGIDMSRVRSYDDLNLLDVGRLTAALARKDLPLSFVLHLSAENPPENTVNARLARMEWTLLLEERETISGTFEREMVLAPGAPADVPIEVSLNLISFFEGNARDLAELALSLAGQGGQSKHIALRARPTIDTPLGPLAYPSAITIVSREVG